MPRLEFDAVIRSAQGGGALVQLPPEAAEVFGTRARFPVRASFNDVIYVGSTLPTGEGGFYLGITKAIQAQAGVEIGHQVHVVVELDTSERNVPIPEDLAFALENAGLTKAFQSLAPTHRREYVQWITESKKADTRERRIAKVIERIDPRMSV
jgi:hypothetical protein